MNPLLINLARRRFANQRPATRAATALWLLALAALAVNGWLYRDYFQGSGERGRRLAEIETGLRVEAETIARSRARLAALDLTQQNALVTFLNEKIDDRTFSWSRLFDRLSQALPEEVRISSLAPERQEKGSGRRRGGTQRGEAEGGREPGVLLSISGIAKTDEALSEFQDRLFAHPSFRQVNLTQESRTEADLISFNLTVDYLPGSTAADEGQTSPAAASSGSVASLAAAAAAEEEK